MEEDYRYWLYNHKWESSEDMFANISSIVSQKPKVTINLLLLESHGEILNELSQSQQSDFEVFFLNGPPVITIEVRKKIQDEEETQRVKAIVCEYPNYPSVYLIISDCTKTEFKNVLTKLIDKQFPHLSKLYLKNSEIRTIFMKLEEETNSAVMVKSVVGRRRLKGNMDGQGEKSQITYTTIQPFETVLNNIESDNQWLDYVKYELGEYIEDEETNTPVFRRRYSGMISRSCFFSCSRNFRHLTDIVMKNALEFISLKNLHVKLSIETAEFKKPEPLMIKFDTYIFEEKSMNKQYTKAIMEMPNCSVSEYHANPYLHLSLLDYLDGSSYDLWVLSVDKIAIIPAFRASKASMDRLLNHIFERISEGEVEHYSEVKSIERY